MIQQYPDKLKYLFVDDISSIYYTRFVNFINNAKYILFYYFPDYIKCLVLPHFSPKHFVNFLDECEGYF